MKNVFFLIIFIFSISCTGKNPIPTAPSSDQVTQTPGQSPIPGNDGAIEVIKVTSDTIEINWQNATDDNTKTEELLYRVYYSTSGEINTTEQIESDANAVNEWTKNIKSLKITGLVQGTKYFVFVIVKNNAGRMALYNKVIQFTTIPDTTPPQVYIKDYQTTFSDNTLKIKWDKAYDNKTPESELEYRLFIIDRNDYLDLKNSRKNLEKYLKRYENTDKEHLFNWSKNKYEHNFSLPSGVSQDIFVYLYFWLCVRDKAGNIGYTFAHYEPKKTFQAIFYIKNMIVTAEYRKIYSASVSTPGGGYGYINLGRPYLDINQTSRERTWDRSKVRFSFTRQAGGGRMAISDYFRFQNRHRYEVQVRQLYINQYSAGGGPPKKVWQSVVRVIDLGTY